MYLVAQFFVVFFGHRHEKVKDFVFAAIIFLLLWFERGTFDSFISIVATSYFPSPFSEHNFSHVFEGRGFSKTRSQSSQEGISSVNVVC